MRLLPYERLTLRSDDPPDVVQAKLATLVTTKWFYLKRPAQPFRGAVQGRHFEVVRALAFGAGSSFWQPVIFGDIAPAPSGTEIRVRMRLALSDAVGTLFWFGGLLYGAAYVLLPQPISVAGWVGLGVVSLIGYTGMTLSFWSDVKKARAALCDGLACRVVEQADALVR